MSLVADPNDILVKNLKDDLETFVNNVYGKNGLIDKIAKIRSTFLEIEMNYKKWLVQSEDIEQYLNADSLVEYHNSLLEEAKLQLDDSLKTYDISTLDLENFENAWIDTERDISNIFAQTRKVFCDQPFSHNRELGPRGSGDIEILSSAINMTDSLTNIHQRIDRYHIPVLEGSINTVLEMVSSLIGEVGKPGHLHSAIEPIQQLIIYVEDNGGQFSEDYIATASYVIKLIESSAPQLAKGRPKLGVIVGGLAEEYALPHLVPPLDIQGPPDDNNFTPNIA